MSAARKRLEFAGLAQPPQVGSQGNQLGAFGGAGPAGSPGGGNGFDGDAQLREAAVLLGAVVRGEAPAHQLGVVDIPERALLHHDAHPPARVHEVHGLQDLHGVPRNGAGDPVLLLEPLQREPAARRKAPGRDGNANRLQNAFMHRGGGPAVVRVIRVP